MKLTLFPSGTATTAYGFGVRQARPAVAEEDRKAVGAVEGCRVVRPRDRGAVERGVHRHDVDRLRPGRVIDGESLQTRQVTPERGRDVARRMGEPIVGEK